MGALDRSLMTLNHDDSYILISEKLFEIKGLSCLEFYILARLRADECEAEEVFMLDQRLIVGESDDDAEEQPSSDTSHIGLWESAPIDYLDQPMVLEALLNLEKKGLITISRN